MFKTKNLRGKKSLITAGIIEPAEMSSPNKIPGRRRAQKKPKGISKYLSKIFPTPKRTIVPSGTFSIFGKLLLNLEVTMKKSNFGESRFATSLSATSAPPTKGKYEVENTKTAG